jgi:hypothetical protein
MNLAVLTTVGINAGDNFIYEGFKNLFPAKLYGSVFLINKVEVPKDNSYKRSINESDLVVICGSPIFYEKCYRMKWQNRILEYSEKSDKKILLFAVGGNFGCSADGIVKSPDTIKDDGYESFISRYSKVMLGDFTVRDRYCFQFLRDMGFRNVHQVVCPSLFAYDERRVGGNNTSDLPAIPERERDLVFVIWGDTHWNCPLPPKRILKTCEEVWEILKAKFSNKKIVWVCHDLQSYSGLVKRVPRRDVLFSTNYVDFLKYYSRCYFAFSVKVHGTMLLASMGVPSLLLQLDSRAAVIEALGENYAVPSAPVDTLIDMCDKKLKGVSEYRDKIIALKSKYREDYRNLFGRLGFI